MQISRFGVSGLFGLFNHHVSFKTRERITIIHGPNGVGKTTFLRLIEAVFSKRYEVLRQIEYSTIEIRFTGRQRLTIHRSKGTGNSSITLLFTFTDGGEKKRYTYESGDVRHARGFPLHMIDDLIPNLTRVGAELWADNITGDMLTLSVVISRYPEYFPEGAFKRIKTQPEWLTGILDSLSVYFIQTQRLLAMAEASPSRFGVDKKSAASRMTVEDLSKDMARRIQDVLRSSGALAASLDRTFPHRLLQGKLPLAATEQKIRKRYEEQSEYRKRLMDAGLLQPEETLPLQQDQLDRSERKVLWYYLGDIDKKLEVYRNLLERAELFMRVINDNKFLYKKLSIHKDKGFIFTSHNDSDVPLSALSSGEQHELVLAYELLFRASSKSLILIDEPELSLHVTWQHKFLDDMKQISELADLDFLIATHSPSIVHRRTDLMVELGEVYE